MAKRSCISKTLAFLVLCLGLFIAPKIAQAAVNLYSGQSISYTNLISSNVRNELWYSYSNSVMISQGTYTTTITAVRPGLAYISHSWENKLYRPNYGYYWQTSHYDFYINVIQPLTSFTIPASLSVNVDQTATLKVTKVPATSNATISYKSSDVSIATVNASGTVTGVKAGQCKITVSSYGCAAQACTVTVKPNPLKILSVDAGVTASVAHDALKWTVQTKYGRGSILYSFSVYRGDQLIKKTDYGASSTFFYTPAQTGGYSVYCSAKDSYSSASLKSGVVTVTAKDLAAGICAGKATIPIVGVPISYTCSAKYGDGDYSFQYNILKDGKSIVQSAWLNTGNFTYTPQSGGTYAAVCTIKCGNQKVTATSDNLVVSAKRTAKITAALPAYANENIVWTLATSGGYGTPSISYDLYFNKAKIASTGFKTALTSYSYLAKNLGSYYVIVKIKDDTGTLQLQSAAVSAAARPLQITGINAAHTDIYIGATERFTMVYTGGYGTVQYMYNVYFNGSQVYTGKYSTQKYLDYNPAKAGKYTVKAFAKDSYSSTAKSVDFIVYDTAPQIISITPSALAVNLGDKVTWTVKGVGTGTRTYVFSVYLNGEKISTYNNGGNPVFVYTPRYTGTYKVACSMSIGSKQSSLTSTGVAITSSGVNFSTGALEYPKTAEIGETITFKLECFGTMDRVTITPSVTCDGSDYTDFKVDRKYYGIIITMTPKTPGTYQVYYTIQSSLFTLHTAGGSCIVGSGSSITPTPEAPTPTPTPTPTPAPTEPEAPTPTPTPTEPENPTPTPTPTPGEVPAA